jgi:hypothetical protein
METLMPCSLLRRYQVINDEENDGADAPHAEGYDEAGPGSAEKVSGGMR